MIEFKTFSKTVYDEIKDRIIKREYEPGSSINERQLSNDLGISRTPIREALQRLTLEGWIINNPYKKTVIRQFTTKDVLDAQKMRTVLETFAISEALINIRSEDINMLEELVYKQKNEKDYFNFIKIDREFHEIIYKKSENSFLIAEMETINDIVRYFGLLAIDVPERRISTVAEHEHIVNELKNGNKERIKQSMQQHMDNTRQALVKRLDIL